MLRILIVDDLADTAESLSTLLKLRGHETRVALRGEQAVMTASIFKPDLLLLDIAMPGLGGIAVARRVHALPGLEKAVVVAISGFDGEETRRLAWEAGIEHFLTKPVDPHVLFTLVDAHDWEQVCPPLA